MELRWLRYFLTVAEERHFGRAAARLGIAQPPLSRQVQALERELGLSLFDRSRRQIGLTPAGTVLMGHARRLLDDVERAAAETRLAGTGEIGRLVLGYPSSVAYSGLTDLLRAYRARFPAVEISLHEGSPQAVVDGLRSGRLDVGFVRGPFEHEALRSERFIDEPLMVAMANDHPMRKHRILRLRALADQPFVLFPRERSPWFYDLILRLCREAGFEPRIAQQAPAVDVVSLVAVGLGVAIVPASWRDLRRERIVFRPLEGNPRTELLLAWSSREVAPAAQRFIELVRRTGHTKKPRAAS